MEIGGRTLFLLYKRTVAAPGAVDLLTMLGACCGAPARLRRAGVRPSLLRSLGLAYLALGCPHGCAPCLRARGDGPAVCELLREAAKSHPSSA